MTSARSMALDHPPTDCVTISFRQALLFPLPDIIYVNDALFARVSVYSQSDLSYFVGPHQDTITAIALPALIGTTLPSELRVNGEQFTRRCERFYTPTQARPGQVEAFFDLISTKYEDSIEMALNLAVIHRMVQRATDFSSTQALAQINLLDYGCGTGLASFEVQRRRVPPTISLFGCDLSERMVAIARDRTFATVEKAAYAHTSFADGLFDVIISCFVAHYFLDVQPLREMLRLLKPTGLLLFNLPRKDIDQEHFFVQSLRELSGGSANVRRDYWHINDVKSRRVIPIFSVRRVAEHDRAQSEPRPWPDAGLFRDKPFPEELGGTSQSKLRS